MVILVFSVVTRVTVLSTSSSFLWVMYVLACVTFVVIDYWRESATSLVEKGARSMVYVWLWIGMIECSMRRIRVFITPLVSGVWVVLFDEE